MLSVNTLTHLFSFYCHIIFRKLIQGNDLYKVITFIIFIIFLAILIIELNRNIIGSTNKIQVIIFL